MREQVAAKKKAIRHVEKANQQAKGKQPIITRDPMLAVQDVDAAKTRAANRGKALSNNAKWAR